MPEVPHGGQPEATQAPSPVARAPTFPHELVAMLDLLAQTVVQALGFGVAVINIARPDGFLEVVAAAGDEHARAALLGSVESAEVWDRSLAVSEPWGRLRFTNQTDDLASWIPDVDPIIGEDAWHPEDALFAPLTAENGSRLGILSVDLPRDGRRPDRATCTALEAFALAAALAIEHATLRSQAESSERTMRWLATHDPLTGAGNRSIFFERLAHIATARAEHRSLLALAFIDLDNFKVVNDHHSHDAGDHILQVVTDRLRAVVRTHDTVIRWGGDEFLVLLEQLDDEPAGLEVAERILQAVAEPIRYLDQDFGVTASVGLTFAQPVDEIDADDLVRQADSAMYRVKRSGRNACTVFMPVPQPADPG